MPVRPRAPPRRHRYRRRQPVERGRAREPDIREHLRAAAAARALCAPRRAADLRHHPSRRQRPAVGGRPVAAPRRRRLRGRRAPSRLGDAALFACRRAASSVCLDAAEGAVRGAARIAHDAPSSRAVGQRPVSYRSGRFGFSADHVAALERARYLVESSVAPLFYETHKGGPGLRRGAAHPVLPRLRQRRQPGSSSVLEVPVSAGLNRRLPRRPAARVRACASQLHDETGARALGVARHAVAAAVVLVARRHVRPRPASWCAARCPSSTSSSTRARPSSAEARTIGRKASSTRSAIGSNGSWHLRRVSFEPLP